MNVVMIVLIILTLVSSLMKKQRSNLPTPFKTKNETINHLELLTLPILLTYTVEQIAMKMDQHIASRFGSDAVSTLAYATSTSTVVSGIFITALLVITFPKMAKLAKPLQLTEMKHALSGSIVGMSLFMIPVIAAVTMFAHPVSMLLFQYGAFDAEAVDVMSNLLFFYSFSLLGNGLSLLISRMFFAIGDFKTPVMVAVLTVVTHFVLNVLLTSFVGITGLAVATSLSSVGGLTLLLLMLRRKVGSLQLRRTLISLNKIAGASITMAFGAYSVYQYLLAFNSIMALVVSALVGLGIYGILLLIFRIREVDYLIATTVDHMRKWGGKRK
ncbi:MAG: polysaccharide biosynthesis C-terminal domain-containing protein [Defluviitaleaceae bacterium]|nr:polysaccharide biosynthesis C-terminal domain-containing protein [Defluviitaleaceae bacterium]